ncbi:MAG TPA: putative toxin-antitoxin system toxin component, PIN family [Terriglobales bacterium]|nr:putative toxin-antitoxin system toxin component, PIN family [Terriglobales bacterium]
MRVFLDTNVLVSAFATRGLCADLFRHILAEHDLITGEVVIAELRRVLRERLKVPARTVAAVEQLLRDQVVVPKPAEPHPLPIRDTDDRWVLASAVAGKADVLVTGDSDLLEMASRAPLPIIDPRGFWNMVRGTSGTQE